MTVNGGIWPRLCIPLQLLFGKFHRRLDRLVLASDPRGTGRANPVELSGIIASAVTIAGLMAKGFHWF